MEIRPYTASLAEYFPAVVVYTIYGIVVGAVGGVFGYITQILNITELSVWHIVYLVAAALLVAQFIVFHKARIARDLYAPDKVTWDWTMRQMQNYLALDSSHSARLEGTQGWGMIYLSRLRQAAREGKIYVWGRMAQSTGILNSTIDPIAREYWKTYQFDTVACLIDDDNSPRTEATFQGGSEIYDHLRLNSQQIKKLWKPLSPWKRVRRWAAKKMIPWLTP